MIRPRLPSRSARHAAATLAALVAVAGGTASAQSTLDARPGPFASVDFAGSPFVLGIEGREVAVAAGYRLGRGVDVALRVERAPYRQEPRFAEPGETFVGADVALTSGPARRPWRLAAVGGVAREDRSTLAFDMNGGSEFRGGPRLTALHATASATRFFTLPDVARGVRVLVGVGAFAEVRRRFARTTLFNAGSENEVVREERAVTDTPFGLLLTAPVAVRLSRRATLVVDPTVRLDAFSSVLGLFPYPQIDVRLNL